MKWYKLEEFACKCGCGLNAPDNVLIERLETLCDLLNRKIPIHSACRCVKHNQEVGGSRTSSHLPNSSGLCQAVDGGVANSHESYEIVETAPKAGFTRIGVAATFVHLDTDSNKPQEVLWLYS